MIELIKISKIYEGKEILKEISLLIQNGSFTVISGKSGSGKTSLLSILSGIENPTTGKVTFNDVELSTLNESQKSSFRFNHIALIPQNFNLLDNFTIEENILLPIILENKSTKDIDTAKIIKVLDLQDRVLHYPSELSGGQKQRVAIGRALVKNSKFIIADEITGNLDAEQSQNIIDHLINLNKKDGITVILVTHDFSLITSEMNHYQLINGQLIKVNKSN